MKELRCRKSVAHVIVRKERLVPGMPVEAFMQLGGTVLSYLKKPLADQVAKAWRER